MAACKSTKAQKFRDSGTSNAPARARPRIDFETRET